MWVGHVYDKWGFTCGMCPTGSRVYWHVFHPKYGWSWGKQGNKTAAHHAINFAIGDLRNGVA